MGGRKRRKKKKKKKKANAKSPTERERERVICVRQNVFATVWGTGGAANQQIF